MKAWASMLLDTAQRTLHVRAVCQKEGEGKLTLTGILQ
jgi:hypothetical protein